MGYILINRVKYSGDNFHYESPLLGQGINIIEGSNGSGKSTFMNLIYYCLSGSVPEFKKSNKGSHFEITTDNNNYIDLDITLNDKSYVLRRFIDSNDITVLDSDSEVLVLPIHRSKNEKYIFSDWILQQMGIAVVEVFQGVNNFKINFRDLMRLIYHDQEPNPKKIYKTPDFDNIIADSELVRKIIFQLLIGKTFSDYYSNLAKQKEIEKQFSLKKAVYAEYLTIAKNLNTNTEELNLVYLNEKLSEKNNQLVRLYDYRNSLKKDRPRSSDALPELNVMKASILENELRINEVNTEIIQVSEELLKLTQLRENLILEVTQIKKIIHSHEKLNLFSADTCPYCLRKIDRPHGHCVCGTPIDESQYERFFYSADEYSQIFKAKQKSVDTINSAIAFSLEKQKSIITEKERIESVNNKIKENIKKLINGLGDAIDTSQMDNVDDQILRVRVEINSLSQRIEIEEKLSKLQHDCDTTQTDLEKIRSKVRILEINANEDISIKVREFSQEYNTFMVNTLKDCRNAKIDLADYMPIINNGEYREASSSVPIRLMYYLTLVRMSVLHADIKFPKFLLIDTPDTAGIDAENLIRCIEQISKLTDDSKTNYQILLSTAIGKYPTSFKDKVRISLSDDDRLLKRKSN